MTSEVSLGMAVHLGLEEWGTLETDGQAHGLCPRPLASSQSHDCTPQQGSLGNVVRVHVQEEKGRGWVSWSFPPMWVLNEWF